MYTKSAVASLLALLASSASAQTHTDCSPIKQDCPAAPALGKSISIDYTKGADSTGFFRLLDGTSLDYGDQGAVFKIEKEGNAPTIVSKKYIFFGKVEVELRAAPGAGVVTSVVLQSDDLDEIDWEWVGSDTAQVQTNYFSKGDTTTYDRGAYHKVANPQSEFHTYTIDWTKDSLKWQINGETIRELKYADAKGGTTYPQTPCQVRIGTWVAGGKDSPKGTVEWAGGYTQFSEGPFLGYYKSIKVTDYATGATSYVYGDRSGTYQSIVVKTDGSSDDSTNSTSTATSKSATTKSSTTLATSATSASVSSNATSTGSTASQTGSSGTTGTSGAAASATAAPGAGASNLPNLVLMGAAAIIGYLAL